MVNLINIPDGDVFWGTKMRTNLGNLSDGIDQAALLAVQAYELASQGGGGGGGGTIDQGARDLAAAADVKAEDAKGTAQDAANAAAYAQLTAAARYAKPAAGIPTTDLSTDTQRRISYVMPPRGVVQYKRASAGYYYAVTTVYTNGTFMPGLVDKRFGNDFDVKNPSSTGSAFKPVRERLDSFAARTGHNIVVNASGWKISGNVDEIRGAQIRNGKVLHDFERTDLNGSPQGVEAIGVLADGRMKCYSALRGDTAAKMVAAGVVHSWSFGPNLVIDGVKQDLTKANWQYFLTEISARTIIGQSATGDIIIIALVGKTNSSGITGNDMVNLAAAEGCYNAAVFDGGGSTQMYVEGVYTIPSSDGSTGYDLTTGRRSVPDAFMLTASLATVPLDTGWIDLPLRSGFVATSASQTPQARIVGNEVKFRGQVKPSSGTFGTDSAFVADLPQQFATNNFPARAYYMPGDGGNVRKVAIQTDSSIQVVGTTVSNAAYVALDGMSYFMDGVI